MNNKDKVHEDRLFGLVIKIQVADHLSYMLLIRLENWICSGVNRKRGKRAKKSKLWFAKRIK